MTLERAFEPLRRLELTDAEVAAVLARAAPRRRLRVTALATGAAVAVLVAVLVPAGRAGLADALERFFAGGRPPGEPASTERLDAYLRDGNPHVIARSGDERLIAYRAPSGDVCFDFGGHVGICRFGREMFEDAPVALFGPSHRDEQGRWVLWGLALDSVKRVELRYDTGAATSVAATNGFVMRVDAGRRPHTLLAFDKEGLRVAEIDVEERFARAPVGP
jgi:hypothetical protein